MTAAARYRYTLVAAATVVVIGTGFTVVGLSKHADADTTTTGSRVADSAPLAAGSGTGDPLPPDGAAGTSADPEATIATLSPSPSPSPSASPSSSATTSATPSPSATTKSPAAKRTTKPTRSAGTSAPTKAPTNAPETGGSVLDQVLAHINAARVAEGLGKLSLDTKLSKASALHNQLMIDGCGLSHQCSGESGLGERFSAQGVQWSSAGENIGYGSSGSSDADKIKAANGLTDSMLAEVPPNDGHRKNLLNPGFKRIGLSIVRDSKGITWMTQDFVN
ncbi:CAP domain-containing protein [Micromonosporaceae bacterium Da 78-11]